MPQSRPTDTLRRNRAGRDVAFGNWSSELSFAELLRPDCTRWRYLALPAFKQRARRLRRGETPSAGPLRSADTEQDVGASTIQKHPQLGLRRDPESSKSFQAPQANWTRGGYGLSQGTDSSVSGLRFGLRTPSITVSSLGGAVALDSKPIPFAAVSRPGYDVGGKPLARP